MERPNWRDFDDPQDYLLTRWAWRQTQHGAIAMKISINDREFNVRPMDEGRVALAGFLAMSSGEAVDIPLTDGTVITGVRSGEIELVAKQVLAPR